MPASTSTRSWDSQVTAIGTSSRRRAACPRARRSSGIIRLAGGIRAVILHESGHDLGLQHNFIAYLAYQSKDLQSRSFTEKFGVATSVMGYNPVNLWPKGTPQGDYEQLALGPYDYHAIKWGYEYVPNAITPQAEVPTLNQVASQWSNPLYRFASDEDVDFATGHAIDPRVDNDVLSDRPLTWERTQLVMLHEIMNAVDQRFPDEGIAYDEARRAFLSPLRLYVRDVEMPARYIGGEYLSRAAAGDPNSRPPLQAGFARRRVRGMEAAADVSYSPTRRGDSAQTFSTA